MAPQRALVHSERAAVIYVNAHTYTHTHKAAHSPTYAQGHCAYLCVRVSLCIFVYACVRVYVCVYKCMICVHVYVLCTCV